jgi:arylsulfatase A-like enzyme
MFINWPGKTTPGSRSSALVQNIDLLPTILEMAGAELPADYPIDGRSLLPVIEQPEKEFKKLIYSESGYTRAIFDGRFKYIAFRYPEHLVSQMADGSLKKAPSHVETPGGIPIVNMAFYPAYWDSDQLFDLSQDPYEQHNLASDPDYAEKVAELQAVLKTYLEDFDHPFDLSPQPYMQSPSFKALVMETMKQKPEDIDWYVRDWGRIIWPPED